MKGPQNELLTRENLKRLYVDDPDASLDSVAKQIGCHARTISKWLKKFGLPVKSTVRYGPKSETDPRLADRDWLAKQLETKTGRQIAKEIGAKEAAVSYWKKKHRLWDPTSHSKSEVIKAALKKRYPDGRYGEEAANWQGGRVKHGDYIRIHMPDHPYATQSGYVMEHRLIAERHLGRFLEPDEIVHHKDGDKSNNTWENLEVSTRSNHVSEHFRAVETLTEARDIIAELEAENTRLKAEIERLKAD